MTKTVTIQAQQKWEYNMVTRKSEPALLAELNVVGQEGWEVIDVLYYKDMKGIMCWTAFVKRPSSGPVPPASGAAPAAASVPHAQPAHPAPQKATSGTGFDLDGDEFKLAGD